MTRYDYPETTPSLVVGPFRLAHDTPGLFDPRNAQNVDGAPNPNALDLAGRIQFGDSLPAGTVVFSIFVVPVDGWTLDTSHDSQTGPVLLVGVESSNPLWPMAVFCQGTEQTTAGRFIPLAQGAQSNGNVPQVLDQDGKLWATLFPSVYDDETVSAGAVDVYALVAFEAVTVE